jgi:hypothetical protein
VKNNRRWLVAFLGNRASSRGPPCISTPPAGRAPRKPSRLCAGHWPRADRDRTPGALISALSALSAADPDA